MREGVATLLSARSGCDRSLAIQVRTYERAAWAVTKRRAPLGRSGVNQVGRSRALRCGSVDHVVGRAALRPVAQRTRPRTVGRVAG